MNSEHKKNQTPDKILVWLPSPMGDAVICTPALRTLRKHLQNSHITFLAGQTVHQILSPCSFNNDWLISNSANPFVISGLLRKNKFSHAILFKNSFASALACFLAAIPRRTGYARDCRSLFLTDPIAPQKLSVGRFKPASMIDYYLEIASHLGCSTQDRKVELFTNPDDTRQLYSIFPHLKNPAGPVIILVPGGVFGPSKCWLASRFAQTADRLISKYNAALFVSVSPADTEKKIAQDICRQSKNKITSLAENPLSIGRLKSLFSIADLVITNDTGPRHIAVAFGRNLVTLFGPNDPAWTETGWKNEIKIIGHADCVPCAKPKCRKNRHECMESITVDMVCDAADNLLSKNKL
jgi:heptosyltransferase II